MVSSSFDLNCIDFFQIFDTIDEGVIIADIHGVIHYYSQTQGLIDGLDPSFVIGKKVTDIYALDSDTSMILLCIKHGRPVRNRTFFYKTNFGKVVNTITSTFPIRQETRFVGVICFVQDYNILKDIKPICSHPDYRPRAANGTHYDFADILGTNRELRKSIATAMAAADSTSPVMLIGETGTGKELFAQSIHNQSSRKNKMFVALNCAAIPETLLEGILFGTTRGAFTGAMDKPGLLEQADGSTLFLDELLSMPVPLQAKLLRVLQERKLRRVGSNEEVTLEVKVISSINKLPREAIDNLELRTDLFYRIGVVMVKIPPLRDRLDDLPELVNHFLLQLNNTLGTNVHCVAEEVMSLFYGYHWPGNVRELEHLLEGALNIVGYDENLSLKYFTPAFEYMGQEEEKRQRYPSGVAPSSGQKSGDDQAELAQPPANLLESQEEREKTVLESVLQETCGNISRSAKLLGISRQLFHYKMKKHGLKRDNYFPESQRT
ncbi:MAG: sigma-54 interaction domain-containing protein [Desulfopila sp.]